jgi:hypothetical protein
MNNQNKQFDKYNLFESFNSATAYKVILGGHNITDSGIGTNAIRRSVKKIVKHESFTNDQAFDIALLKLDVMDLQKTNNVFA